MIILLIKKQVLVIIELRNTAHSILCHNSLFLWKTQYFHSATNYIYIYANNRWDTHLFCCFICFGLLFVLLCFICFGMFYLFCSGFFCFALLYLFSSVLFVLVCSVLFVLLCFISFGLFYLFCCFIYIALFYLYYSVLFAFALFY
jgi:hypothetical protein